MSNVSVIAKQCKEERDQLLIVEGKDDCNGIYQLATKYGLAEHFGIWEGGSDQGAIERFGGLLLASKNRPNRLGIVLDSDALDSQRDGRGTERRWAQIRHRLIGFGYELPDAVDPQGTIIDAPTGYPKIGVWLMPNNASDGMFEDFLLQFVPPRAVKFAKRVSLIARAASFGTFREIHLSKAAVHTFLAWQDDPGRPFGIAIRSGLFAVDSSVDSPFMNWLRRLYL